MINKKAFIAVAGAFVLMAAMMLPFKASSQVNVNVELGGHPHRPHGFPHPEIDAAMNHLNEARNNLANAAHDFGGHRAQAMRAIDNAMQQCHKAIEYANSHDR